MVDRTQAIYMAVVGAGGVLLALLLRSLFARAERQRMMDVERLKQFVAVKTESRHLNRGPGAHDRALESIATRFAVIRRITIPLVLLVTAVLVVGPLFGRIPAAALTVIGTVVTIIVGIAAKPILENVIGGVIISFSQPIRIGDVVSIEGRYGLIEQINLTHTVIKLWDWRRFVIPNGRLLQVDYLNYTIIDKWMWAYLSFWVAYDADLVEVRDLALDAAQSSPNAAGPPPGFWIVEMNREGVVCWVAGWVDHPLKAWGLRHDIALALTQAFRERGIRSHIYQHATSPPAGPHPGLGSPPAPPPEP